MRIGSLLLLVWLLIGLAACAQRGYLRGTNTSCTRLGTIVITTVAGPLNYIGANPKVTCDTPKPSK